MAEHRNEGPERGTTLAGKGVCKANTTRLLSARRGGLWITQSNRRHDCPSTLLLILTVSPAAYRQAPPTASAEPQIQALQKKLDALQSQMVGKRRASTTEALSGGSGAPPPFPGSDRSQVGDRKPELSRIEKSWQQAEADATSDANRTSGKATVTYRIFSQDPSRGAAYQQLKSRSIPGSRDIFAFPATNTLMRIGGYAKTDFTRLEARGQCRQLHPSDHSHPCSHGITNSTIIRTRDPF